MRRCRSGLSIIAIFVLAIVGLSVPADAAAVEAGPPAASAGADAQPAAGSPEARALAQAKASGRPVEVTSARTETETVIADPAGHLTARIYAAPIRVRVGSGWKNIDETLRRGSDSRWTPRAATTQVSISNGGTRPFVTVTSANTSMSLSWPTSLPRPTVKGSTAVYADVYPGADLAVNVSGGEVRPALVVKTAAAARDPRVRTLRLGARVAGGRLHSDGSGGLRVVDGKGVAVLSSGPATIIAAGRVNSAEVGTSRDHVPDLRVAVGVSASALTITPNAAALDAPATALPVSIGPAIYGSKSASAWAMVDKHFPNDSYYRWNRVEDSGVGYYYGPEGGPFVKRQFFMFNTSSMRGARILSATFTAYESDSANCVDSRLNAYLSGDISSSSKPTWNRQPSLSSGVLSHWTKKYGYWCKQKQGRVKFRVTKAVQKRADQKRDYTTISLRAADEKTNDGHRRFLSPVNSDRTKQPNLQISYNRSPYRPSARQMAAPDRSTGCATKLSSAPTINPFTRVLTDDGVEWRENRSAKLSTTSRDPDGDHVRAAFTLYRLNGRKGYQWVGSASSSWGTSGSNASVVITDTINRKDSKGRPRDDALWLINGNYRWQARVSDEYGPGNMSTWCYFKLDRDPPTMPTITSKDYEDSVVGERRPSATFTFSSPDATRFVYRMNGVGLGECPSTTAPTCTVDSTGTATVTLNLSGFSNELAVQSQDKAGNQSDWSTFRIKSGVKDRAGQYLFNPPVDDASKAPNEAKEAGQEQPDPELALESSGQQPLGWVRGLNVTQVRRGASLTPGTARSCHLKKPGWCALRFGDGEPEGRSLGVPVATGKAFTLGTWVWLDDASIDRSAISATRDAARSREDLGAAPPVFELGWSATANRFTARLRQADGTMVTATDQLPAANGSAGRANGWVYLMAVSTGQRLRLDAVRLEREPSCRSCEWSYEAYPGTDVRVSRPANAAGLMRVGGGAAGGWDGVIDGLALWREAKSNFGADNDLQFNSERQP